MKFSHGVAVFPYFRTCFRLIPTLNLAKGLSAAHIVVGVSSNTFLPSHRALVGKEVKQPIPIVIIGHETDMVPKLHMCGTYLQDVGLSFIYMSYVFRCFIMFCFIAFVFVMCWNDWFENISSINVFNV